MADSQFTSKILGKEANSLTCMALLESPNGLKTKNKGQSSMEEAIYLNREGIPAKTHGMHQIQYFQQSHTTSALKMTMYFIGNG